MRAWNRADGLQTTFELFARFNTHAVPSFFVTLDLRYSLWQASCDFGISCVEIQTPNLQSLNFRLENFPFSLRSRGAPFKSR